VATNLCWGADNRGAEIEGEGYGDWGGDFSEYLELEKHTW